MRVARYDPETARALLDPIARRAGVRSGHHGRRHRQVIVALGLISPQKAVSLLEGFPDAPPDTVLHQAKNRARWDLAAMLARPGERRWKYLQWNFFHNWVPDVEDIVANVLRPPSWGWEKRPCSETVR